MEFLELVSRRESVRSYDPSRPVAQETLHQILEAGRLAPSAANRQPWQFLLISAPQLLTKVRASYQRPWFHDAPHILVVKGFVDQAWVRSYDQYNSLETDLTIAMDHLILAAASLGVGSCWIAAFDPAILCEALALKKNERVFAITPLGYPRADYSPTRQKDRKAFDAVVRYL